MADLFFPPGVRYTCIRCGECCRGLEVTLTEAEHERLAARDWSAEVPGYSPDGFFARIRRARGRQVWRLRPHPGGACRLLTGQNLCRVHAALGLAAKPFAGRLFPYSFVVTPVGAFVGCRFNCPAVARGKGPTLEEQRREIEQLFGEYVRTYDPPREGDRVRFLGRFELGWHDVVRLEDQLIAFLLLGDLAVPRRLLACWRLVRQFAAAAAGGKGGERVGGDPEAILAEVREGAEEPPRLSATERLLLRLLAASFLGATLPGYRELPLLGRIRTRLGNLWRRLKIALGRGRVRLPGVEAAVAVAEVERVEGTGLDAESTAMLERYFVAKVASQGFFGRACFGRSFAEGLDFLATAYGAVLWLAAAHAAAAGRQRVEADDVEYGIRQADYGYNYLGELGGVTQRLRGIFFWHRGTAGKVLGGRL